ncbi:Meiotic expression up-regulated protein 26 [Smittium culicis]|uniref:Meiotic expression up-regulated protein 26 n=1 Tax=Smittium culicis TaxID=133412 RepID=A0A1R1X4F0_9FUNG|nr:Meiotic expression up-regulated protein 26 [Smittium culicis]
MNFQNPRNYINSNIFDNTNMFSSYNDNDVQSTYFNGLSSLPFEPQKSHIYQTSEDMSKSRSHAIGSKRNISGVDNGLFSFSDLKSFPMGPKSFTKPIENPQAQLYSYLNDSGMSKVQTEPFPTITDLFTEKSNKNINFNNQYQFMKNSNENDINNLKYQQDIMSSHDFLNSEFFLNSYNIHQFNNNSNINNNRINELEYNMEGVHSDFSFMDPNYNRMNGFQIQAGSIDNIPSSSRSYNKIENYLHNEIMNRQNMTGFQFSNGFNEAHMQNSPFECGFGGNIDCLKDTQVPCKIDRRYSEDNSLLKGYIPRVPVIPGVTASPKLPNRRQSAPDISKDNNDPDDLLTPRRQKLRFKDDLYTPMWVRNAGQLKEGFCDTCSPGKWLQLKNSAYWYHKQFLHGVSSISGQPFIRPLEINQIDDDTFEGLCHQCKKWIVIATAKRQNSVLWYRHAHKCHVYTKPKSDKHAHLSGQNQKNHNSLEDCESKKLICSLENSFIENIVNPTESISNILENTAKKAKLEEEKSNFQNTEPERSKINFGSDFQNEIYSEQKKSVENLGFDSSFNGEEIYGLGNSLLNFDYLINTGDEMLDSFNIVDPKTNIERSDYKKSEIYNNSVDICLETKPEIAETSKNPTEHEA